MSQSSSSASGGIGFFGMLAILFIGLKLTSHIDWPWYWVLSPLWLPFVVVLAIIVAIVVAIGLGGLVAIVVCKIYERLT